MHYFFHCNEFLKISPIVNKSSMSKHVRLVATYILENNIEALFYMSGINLGGDHVAIYI